MVGCIGTGDRWKGGIVGGLREHGDIVAVCDVDRKHAEKAASKAGGKADIYEDYRKIARPQGHRSRHDRHARPLAPKIAIEAMKAGKDVYCEKPLTLTIDEGKQICKVLKETGRVFQVGTQQRSEMDQRFLKAVAMVRDGRIGKIKKVTCAIGGAPTERPVRADARPAGAQLGHVARPGAARCDYTRESRATTSSAGGTNTPAAR